METLNPTENLDWLSQMDIAGEPQLLKSILVACVSSQLPDPLSIFIGGSSSSGKSTLVKAVLENLTPRSWWENTVISEISPKVLSKFEPDFFKHKIIFIDETHGRSDDVDYQLRIVQSEGKFQRWVTGKGGESTKETINGPVTIIDTTSDDFNSHKEDNLNRAIIVQTDESQTQTENILISQAKAIAAPKKINTDFFKPYRQHLSKLKKIAVYVPYAENIIPKTRRLQERRDFPKINRVIRTIALMRQFDKPTRKSDLGEAYLEADFQDYESAYSILNYMFQATVHTSDTLKYHFSALKKGLKKKEIFNARDFENHTGLKSTRTKIVLKKMVEEGFITQESIARGNQFALYKLSKVEPKRCNFLVTPDELKQALTK
ncbi:MAG: hypothetical protein AB8G05_00750 [Oligoflexales bacterium]